MREHLPVLQVALPLMSAPVCLMIGHRTLSRLFAIAVAWAGLAITLMLVRDVHAAGVISYELGGFPPPWGIELRLDRSNVYVLLIVSMMAAVVFPFGPASFAANVPEGKTHQLYTMLLLCLCGLVGITVTGDAFNVFVFLEISSLSSYALVALGKGRHAPMAAFSYLVMGTIGGTFYLLGVGLAYQCTGTLNMGDLAVRLVDAQHGRTIIMAFGLLCVGISVKLAVFPLHSWLPNAYAHAPHPVSAFLASTSTKVMFYALARLIFTVFGATFVFDRLHLHYLLVPTATVAMFVGSIAAIWQTDIKRMLAYSSVAQIGYMVLGISFNSVAGVTGAFAHLFNHALMKGGLFLVVACVAFRIHSTRIEDWQGLGRKMPLSMAAFVVGGLSLIGVPSTVGFISKWYLVLGALEKGWYAVALLILLSSLLAVVYVWRVVEIIYLRERPEGPEISEAPVGMLVPTWVLIGACIVFGLTTDLTAGAAEAAARQLMGLTP